MLVNKSRVGEKSGGECRLSLRFWFILMKEQTEVMGKSNPHGLDLPLRVARCRSRKPSVENLACTSKGEALWEEPTDLQWISISKPRMLS